MFAPPERLAERDIAITAMLPHVPFDGWSRAALVRGLADAGLPEDEADLLFPGGAVDRVETWCDMADRAMVKAAETVTESRLSDRVRAIIAWRLAYLQPHKAAFGRALAVLALRGNARVAIACTARTVDAIWHTAGDTSADFSWYTKRGILAGVYTSTLLYWLTDMTPDNELTLRFLDRRLAAVGRIGALRRRLDSALSRPRPA